MDTKQCYGCGEEKGLTEFTWKNEQKGIRHSRCRDCTRQQVRRHYHAHQLYYVRKALQRKAKIIATQREWLLNFLDLHPCVDCGEADPRCLDFDHIRGRKISDISQMVGNYGWERIQQEVAKCEVRCANCHRKRTCERRKLFQWQRRP